MLVFSSHVQTLFVAVMFCRTAALDLLLLFLFCLNWTLWQAIPATFSWSHFHKAFHFAVRKVFSAVREQGAFFFSHYAIPQKRNGSLIPHSIFESFEIKETRIVWSGLSLFGISLDNTSNAKFAPLLVVTAGFFHCLNILSKMAICKSCLLKVFHSKYVENKQNYHAVLPWIVILQET